jgi:hypothetical protein
MSSAYTAVPRTPIVAVRTLIARRAPGENTDSTAPVTMRRPSATSAPARPATSTRALPRTSIASLPMTKTSSPSLPVVMTSPALTSMPSRAGAPLTRASPCTR